MDDISVDQKRFVTIDDVNKIRILDPEVAQKTEQLKSESKEFIECTEKFQRIVDGFLSIILTLSKRAEKEKMKAIGLSNIVNSLSRHKESEQIQLQTLLMEKSIELERLKIQHQSLLKTQQQQEEYIDLLLSSK